MSRDPSFFSLSVLFELKDTLSSLSCLSTLETRAFNHGPPYPAAYPGYPKIKKIGPVD